MPPAANQDFSTQDFVGCGVIKFNFYPPLIRMRNRSWYRKCVCDSIELWLDYEFTGMWHLKCWRTAASAGRLEMNKTIEIVSQRECDRSDGKKRVVNQNWQTHTAAAVDDDEDDESLASYWNNQKNAIFHYSINSMYVHRTFARRLRLDGVAINGTIEIHHFIGRIYVNQ